ncbi:MAG: alkaline phosphatase, partial [Sphaerochaetaceae bacterium]
HPDETLIVVTGDHETGGMTIGFASTGYNTAFKILENQKVSYIAFDSIMDEAIKKNPHLSFQQALALVESYFGLVPPGTQGTDDVLVLSELEYSRLEEAFRQAMLPESSRADDQLSYQLYGSYNPFSITLTHILNNKAGIGWTSYAHTGTPVGVFAYGVGSEQFAGSYDNTDVFVKLKTLVDVV